MFDPARESKGGVKWHTIEGSFTLKRKGRYYQMFSGGNWTNQTYGAGYAVTERIDRPDEWDQPCDAETMPLVMRTFPAWSPDPATTPSSAAPTTASSTASITAGSTATRCSRSTRSTGPATG